MSFGAGWIGGALSVGLLHCAAAVPLGATADAIDQARFAAPPGADAFDRECASCHGQRGEGLSSAPAIMGAGALAEQAPTGSSSSSPGLATSARVHGDLAHVPGQSKRGPFRTARDVYDYVSSRMPLPQSVAGTLQPEEYWAIVNYMLIAQGVSVPSGGVTEANARSVALR